MVTMRTRLVVLSLLIVAVAAVVVAKHSASQNPPAGPVASQSAPLPPAPSDALSSTASALAVPLPRLVDLGSTTCIPCKMMAPILDELKVGYKGRLDVAVVDVAKDPSAMQTFRISIIPTQVFFDAAGKELWRHEGFISKQDILAKWTEFGFDFEKGAPGAETR